MFQECFLAYYQSQSQQIHDHFVMAVKYFDPDGIHDMRVEIKQLRAFFTLIEWVAPTFRAKKRIRKIRKLFKAAAEIRDIHVQQELTREWAKQFGLALYEYYNFLKQREIRARKHFVTYAKAFDITKECEKNEKKIKRSLEEVSHDHAAEKTRERVKQLMDRILEFGSENRLQREHLHKVRILTKEARYTIEIARQCFPELGYSEELSEKLRGLHQVLGKWHDTEIALERVAAFQAESLEQIAMISVYDELSHRLRKEKTDLLTTFEERWDDFITFFKPTPTPPVTPCWPTPRLLLPAG